MKIQFIRDRVSDAYGLMPGDMQGQNKKSDIAIPRMVSMCLAREYVGASWKGIAIQFGNRDHTTVIHAHRAIIDRIKTNLKLRREVLALAIALPLEYNSGVTPMTWEDDKRRRFAVMCTTGCTAEEIATHFGMNKKAVARRAAYYQLPLVKAQSAPDTAPKPTGRPPSPPIDEIDYIEAGGMELTPEALVQSEAKWKRQMGDERYDSPWRKYYKRAA